MLNHKTKEAVDRAFVRRLSTDTNESTSESDLAHEHNAHSADVSNCIRANRSANMSVPCRKSVRCGLGGPQHTRRMTAAPRALAPTAFSFGGVRYGRIAPAVYLQVCGLTPCGEPLCSPCPSVRSANPHGVALPLGGGGRF